MISEPHLGVFGDIEGETSIQQTFGEKGELDIHDLGEVGSLE